MDKEWSDYPPDEINASLREMADAAFNAAYAEHLRELSAVSVRQ